MYDSEISILTKVDEKFIRRSKTKIPRRIFGPIDEKSVRRIRKNKELILF